MTRFFFLIIFFSVFHFNSIAQNFVKVNYFEFINNSTPIKRGEVLYINPEENKTLFVLDIGNQVKLDQSTEKIERETENLVAIASISRSNNLEYVELDFNSNKIYSYQDFVKVFYKISDLFPVIEWKLLNESKLINNILCYKASGNYRGRIWEAWYAPSIPLSYGPWKLNGLPGLILEANDIDFKYHYLMTSIEFNKNEFAKIPIDKSISEVSMKEFLTIKDDFYNTPKDFGRDILDTSKKHNFLNRETEFEFPIKFKWEE